MSPERTADEILANLPIVRIADLEISPNLKVGSLKSVLDTSDAIATLVRQTGYLHDEINKMKRRRAQTDGIDQGRLMSVLREKETALDYVYQLRRDFARTESHSRKPDCRSIDAGGPERIGVAFCKEPYIRNIAKIVANTKADETTVLGWFNNLVQEHVINETEQA